MPTEPFINKLELNPLITISVPPTALVKVSVSYNTSALCIWTFSGFIKASVSGKSIRGVDTPTLAVIVPFVAIPFTSN